MAPDDDERFVRCDRVAYDERAAVASTDLVTREEPLEIQIGGAPLAVIMRTPGHDEELAWGFLRTERVIDDPSQVQSIRHCATAPSPEAEGNVLQIVLRPGVTLDLERLRRNLYASSSCGICGKAAIENVLHSAPPVVDESSVDIGVLYELPDRLRSEQSVFSRTGGLHAAGVFSLDGRAVVVREDVGRHNAVDKVVGWATLRGVSLGGHILLVSGRTSYEIVQKALAARIPIVAAVSAPSSLAVDLARRADMTLAGFVRGHHLSLYAGAERVRGDGMSTEPSP
jgi:FdhD protein